MTKNWTNTKKITSLALIASLGFSLSVSAKRLQGKTTILQKSKAKTVKKVKMGLRLSDIKSPFVGWAINSKSSINLFPAWKEFEKKKEITVAVVDTGIDPNHPFLKENIYTATGKAKSKNYGIDFAKNRKNIKTPFDDHGHGTHVSAIVKSVFPQVKLVALKYYDKTASGQDNLNSTIKALEYAVDQNVDIINYSGGGPEPSLEELRILKRAEQKGILIVAAAGNEESNIDKRSNAYYPASYNLSNIITVTAHDQRLLTLKSSNWGVKSVDISAPGYRIKSALPNGRAGSLTGTSQATAFVSGAAALLMSQFPNLSTQNIKEIIKKSARKEKTLVGKCSTAGRLDLSRAHKLAAATSFRKVSKRVLATNIQKKQLRKAN